MGTSVETTTSLIVCEVRLADDPSRATPGRISGMLLPYDRSARTRSEKFSPGALRWASDGIVLNTHHDSRTPFMRVVPLADKAGVRIDSPLPDTSRGRDVAAELRGGLYRGLSVEFRSLKEHREGLLRVIDDAWLEAASLVTNPDYETEVEVRQEAHTGYGVLPWL